MSCAPDRISSYTVSAPYCHPLRETISPSGAEPGFIRAKKAREGEEEEKGRKQRNKKPRGILNPAGSVSSKCFHPPQTFSLAESFSLTSLRKTRLRSSPASRAMRPTIWPPAPITIRCGEKKHSRVRERFSRSFSLMVLVQICSGVWSVRTSLWYCHEPGLAATIKRQHEDVLEVSPALLTPQSLQLLSAQSRAGISVSFQPRGVLVGRWLWLPLGPLFSLRRLDDCPDPQLASVHHSTCQLCCDVQQPVLSLQQVHLRHMGASEPCRTFLSSSPEEQSREEEESLRTHEHNLSAMELQSLDQRSLDCSQSLRMRRKLLPQTAAAAAAVIRQRRATGENLSVLNHGDVLNDAFRRGKRRCEEKCVSHVALVSL
ncbi:hypothetical protein F7725_007165 [Dissostichus mawsoni]|uniref:Uncharacterized protein n=1 Tax=Dissostichus mawsoni TaxID=36200 RepID=A0A7J5XX03_DISMA|nr:hypothetical protein F7725_007165 [Dissostichus mawsoni]